MPEKVEAGGDNDESKTLVNFGARRSEARAGHLWRMCGNLSCGGGEGEEKRRTEEANRSESKASDASTSAGRAAHAASNCCHFRSKYSYLHRSPPSTQLYLPSKTFNHLYAIPFTHPRRLMTVGVGGERGNGRTWRPVPALTGLVTAGTCIGTVPAPMNHRRQTRSGCSARRPLPARGGRM